MFKHYTLKRRILLEERANAFDSPLKALESFINDVAEVDVKDAQGCFAIKTAFEVSPEDKAIQALLKDDNDFTHWFLDTLIRGVVSEGTMSADTDTSLVAEYIISTCTGWYELYILLEALVKIKKLAAFTTQQLLRQFFFGFSETVIPKKSTTARAKHKADTIAKEC